MSVTIEFSVPADAFLLGQVLAAEQDVRIHLERIVPTSGELVPFFWAQADSGDFEPFEATVRSHSLVDELHALDRLDDEVHYQVSWAGEPESLIGAIVRTQGTVIEGNSVDGSWEFAVRFLDHDSLTRFHDSMTDRGIALQIDRIYTASSDQFGRPAFHLTAEQREALYAAVEGGYFEVPRGIKLDEVAADIGISRQAASERVRRGADIVLREALLGESE